MNRIDYYHRVRNDLIIDSLLNGKGFIDVTEVTTSITNIFMLIFIFLF